MSAPPSLGLENPSRLASSSLCFKYEGRALFFHLVLAVRGHHLQLWPVWLHVGGIDFGKMCFKLLRAPWFFKLLFCCCVKCSCWSRSLVSTDECCIILWNCSQLLGFFYAAWQALCGLGAKEFSLTSNSLIDNLSALEIPGEWKKEDTVPVYGVF